nr:hypothetical protein [Staphylococcus aureus]
MLVVCRKPMTNLNYEEDQSKKQHQDHFNLKVPYCCSLFITFQF